jgi:ABC-type transport system substrate-binding protein
MTFERNPDYYETDDFGKQLPYLDGWELYQMADAAGMLSAFMANRTDYYGIGQTPGTEGWPQIEKQNLDVTALPGYGGNWPSIYINKNSNLEALRDPRVRKAMTMLFNQEEIALAIFKTTDEVIYYNNAIFQPGMGASQEDVASIMGWDKPYEERVAEAKKLMADAGYADGFTIYIPAMTVQMVLDACTLLGETWKKHLNIEYNLEPVSYPDYREKLGRGATGSAYDVMLGQFSATAISDPGVMADTFTTGAKNNFLNFANLRVDELFLAAESDPDPAKRHEMYAEIERLLISEHTIMSSPVTAGSLALWSYVKDYELQYPFQGTLFTRTWLDK